MANDELGPKDQTVEPIERKLAHEFDDSRVRDEEIRDLMKLGLRADDTLREEMRRRFDESDRKNAEVTALLRDLVRQIKEQT